MNYNSAENDIPTINGQVDDDIENNENKLYSIVLSVGTALLSARSCTEKYSTSKVAAIRFMWIFLMAVPVFMW